MKHRTSISAFTSLLLLLGLILPAATLAKDPVPPGSVVSSSGRVLPPLPPDTLQPTIHAEMLAEESTLSFAFESGGSPTIALGGDGKPASSERVSAGSLSAQSLPNGLRKEVFGFLPYWMLSDTALADLNYNLLSTIAYFSVGANKNGDLVVGSAVSPSTGWAGWTSSRMTQVINQAHTSGVRVVLTVTMMAWDSTSAANQATLLTTPAKRARLIGQIVDAVGRRSADGVNLDFEPLATSLRGPYVAFVKELKAGLVAAGVGDYLTVSVMASAATWATGYDIPGLTAADAADALFVMGYDYNWSGSSRAGGVAPVQSPYTIDVDGTMRDFLAEASGAKLIWGVPYYGRTWPTTTNKLNAQTVGGGSKAYYYTGHLAQANQYGRRWDDVGKVPWYRYWDGAAGNWVEGYYDDVESLGVKYDLINARGLAGTGMWTLLMDQGADELWRLLADKFVDDSAPPVGGITLLPEVVDGQSVEVSWNAIDYASGVRDYTVQVRRVGGSWETWLSGTKATSAWYTASPGTYEFRVRAVDWKGNAQAWVSVPAAPASVAPDAFATVVTPTLYVRSGPGTGYGIVTSAANGDHVFVLDGPTSANGYDWYRVQYGFAEWPAAGYPHIGWMAAASGATPYLAPARPPTITTVDPAVTVLSATTRFSPNGDGKRDSANVKYSLSAPADSVVVDVLDSHGSAVRTMDLGAQSAGNHRHIWDGRTGGGTWVAEGTYLLRVTATVSGTAHVAPAMEPSASVLAKYGTRADVTPPTIRAVDPIAGARMVSAGNAVRLTFSEPVKGAGSSNVQLRLGDGTVLPASIVAQQRGRKLIVQPDAPLPAATRVKVWIGHGAHDRVGNPLAATSWSFVTAPGVGYRPTRRVVVKAGAHTAFRIAGGGALSDGITGFFGSTSGAKVSHRGRLPNLPGRWLYVADGAFADHWLRESPRDHLKGVSERTSLPASTRITVRPGTQTGYRFDSSGAVTATRRATLGAVSGANVDARAIINGRVYLAVVNGIWAGYWLPETPLAFMRGKVDRIGLASLPRLDFAAGTYTGYRYSSSGAVTGTVTATLPRASGANAKAWAIINGIPHFRILNGIWADTWVPETAGITLHAG